MIKNAIKWLLRYKKFTLLNITGLTIAFTLAYLFFTASMFDLSFNKGIKDSDEIFVVTFKHPDISQGQLPSAMVRMLVDGNPYVDNYHFGPILDVIDYYNSDGEEDYFLSGRYSQETLNMLGVRLLDGDWGYVYERGAIALTASVADKLGVKVGDDITIKVDGGKKNIMLGAIFEDFPKNSCFTDVNSIIKQSYDPKYYDSSDWNVLLAILFVKLNADADKDDFLSVFSRRLAENGPADLLLKGMTPENVGEYIELTPLAEPTRLPADYFYRPAMTKAYIYLTISVLILVIAFINFFNMFVALIPRRIRNINTLKIFGASTVALRLEIVIEAFSMVAVAMLLSGLIVLVLEDYRLIINEFGTYSPIVNADAAKLLMVMVLLGMLFVIIYPLWYITSFQPAFVLKKHFGASPAGKMLRNSLIGIQFVISFVFVTLTLLINRQNDFVCSLNSEVDFKNAYLGTISYHLDYRIRQSMLPELYDAFMSHPQIVDVAFSEKTFFSERADQTFFFEHKDAGKRKISINIYRVSKNFLDFLSVDIVEGRNLSDVDDKGSYLVFNETARDLFDIKVGDNFSAYSVVGICRDFHQESSQKKIEPSAYICGPMPEEASFFTTCYIRTTDNCDFSSLYEHYRTKLKAVQPMTPDDVYLDDFKTLLEANWYQDEFTRLRIMFIASLISIMLSLLGVFGLVSFETEYRSREIAIRRVNGATVGSILWLFNSRFIRVLVLCYIISLPFSVYAISLWLMEFVYKAPFSLIPYLFSCLSVSVVTFLVVTLSAWRVVNRNPVDVLSKE